MTSWKELRRAHEAQGVCIDCGGERKPGRRRCVSCLAADRQRQAARRERNRKAGRCIVCGQGKPAAGNVTCGPCIVRGTERGRHIRRSRIKAGLCPQCRMPWTGPAVTCGECRGYMREMRRLKESAPHESD